MSVATKTTEAAGERRLLASNEFRDIIGRFASGVTVITVEHEEQPYGARRVPCARCRSSRRCCWCA